MNSNYQPFENKIVSVTNIDDIIWIAGNSLVVAVLQSNG